MIGEFRQVDRAGFLLRFLELVPALLDGSGHPRRPQHGATDHGPDQGRFSSTRGGSELGVNRWSGAGVGRGDGGRHLACPTRGEESGRWRMPLDDLTAQIHRCDGRGGEPGGPQQAPCRARTTETVLTRIVRSTPMDQFST